MARSCEHDEKECVPCFQERIKSVGVSPAAVPSRSINGGKLSKNRPLYNSWERGIAKDDRGVPYLDKHGAPVGVKKFAETRHEYRKHQKTNIDSGVKNDG